MASPLQALVGFGLNRTLCLLTSDYFGVASLEKVQFLLERWNAGLFQPIVIP
jgi:hypothetical protein